MSTNSNPTRFLYVLSREVSWKRLGLWFLVITFVWFSIIFLFFHKGTEGGAPVPLNFKFDLISHGGAGLRQATYSNSRQALQAAVDRGFSKIEMDFLITRDGKIVATHDWRNDYIELHPNLTYLPLPLAELVTPAVPSRAAFMASKMREGLNPIDLEYLNRWLKKHPRVRIITDTKGNNIRFLHTLAQHNGTPLRQFIPQIYFPNELDKVKHLGFKRVIFTLYRDPAISMVDAATFARSHHLSLTIPIARASKHSLLLLHSEHIPTYVHTINSPEEAARLLKWGATGIYTDFLFPAWKKK